MLSVVGALVFVTLLKSNESISNGIEAGMLIVHVGEEYDIFIEVPDGSIVESCDCNVDALIL